MLKSSYRGKVKTPYRFQKIVLSSGLEKDNSLKGQEKVLEICRVLQAGQYFNAIGGMELYGKDEFTSKGIALHFLKTGNVTYAQSSHDFVPNLSMIDMMMHVSQGGVKDKLKQYTLE
ncbi:WbqC family protein [Sphaerochaeta sp. PS]|uniref:WbqC family protein n=1 Tax=Sphaerochaeta sp. PS TaxID=3076336 RepID=UPI0028A53C98|nr:WbqC family protein [Sphaerochaeta sp. PS]MDT4762150.1 WbqC family protein [Sphaerochaeta sp. PS]